MEVMDSMQTGGGDSTIDSFPPDFFNVLVLMTIGSCGCACGDAYDCVGGCGCACDDANDCVGGCGCVCGDA